MPKIYLAGELTDRESVVLESYGRHLSYRAVAAELGITLSTVKNHLANVRAKRKVTRTAALFVRRARSGRRDQA